MADNDKHELIVPEDGDEKTMTEGDAVAPTGRTDMMRQIIIVMAIALCMVVVVYLIIIARKPEMRPLGQYPSADLVKVLDTLDANEVEYTLENGRNSGTIYVPAENYQEVLLLLNREGSIGLEGSTGNGDELILRDPGFGVSQRLEAERLKLSREQQLAKIIEGNTKVEKATVLLAIPKDNVFARDKRKPSATVLVSVKRGTMLSQENVESIVNTVASAVHDLEPSRVTVTDQNGRLLNSGSQDLASMTTRREFEMQQKKELEYKQKIDSILIPVLGIGNYTAEVDVTMDFTAEEKTARTYNPDGQTVRSEVTRENVNGGGAAGGVPGSLSNQPPASSDIPETLQNENGGAGTVTSAAGGSMSREATRNYEIDTVISHRQKTYGGVTRLSVSVGLDYVGEGENRQPRTEAEIDKIRKLLEGGLGIDAVRGDTLEVVSVAFTHAPPAAELEKPPVYEQDWFWRLLKIVAAMVLVTVIVLTLVKPMVEKLLKRDDKQEVDVVDLDDSLAMEGDDDLRLLAASVEGNDSVYNVKNGQIILPDIHKDEDVLRAVRALVSNEPDLAAKVVKDWLEADKIK